MPKRFVVAANVERENQLWVFTLDVVRQCAARNVPWAIENPMGAVTQKMMRRDISFTNHDFGLRACRPRAFETSFPVVKEVDGRWLTKCCCLGRKNRMPRRDRLAGGVRVATATTRRYMAPP